MLALICVVGLLIASPFGILFANEPADSSSVALSTAIAQINVEYADKLEELQEGDYDQIIIDGAPPDWREIVAVFAVKTAGTNDGVDVVTLDADRVARLKEVFWAMTVLSSEVETIDHPDSDPDDGEDDSWTETILTISITGRTVDEMREHYAFTDEQNDMLDDLLENLDLLGGAIGNLAVTEADAKELLASLPADLSAERRAVIETACQLVGKVNYFWGGKSLVLGWDSRWGTTMQVTAPGSSSSGTYRPTGWIAQGTLIGYSIMPQAASTSSATAAERPASTVTAPPSLGMRRSLAIWFSIPKIAMWVSWAQGRERQSAHHPLRQRIQQCGDHRHRGLYLHWQAGILFGLKIRDSRCGDTLRSGPPAL